MAGGGRVNPVKKKTETKAGGIPGVATLIVVFAVLCIAIFSILALSTARSEKKMSDASLENVRAYCAADTAAQEKIAQMREEGKTGVQEFSVPVSDTRQLCVTIEFGNDSYRIIRWQTVYTAEWNPDDGLDVWTGD